MRVTFLSATEMKTYSEGGRAQSAGMNQDGSLHALRKRRVVVSLCQRVPALETQMWVLKPDNVVTTERLNSGALHCYTGWLPIM